MNWLYRAWCNEPVAFVALVKSIITVGCAFGFQLTTEQTVALYSVVESIGTIIARSQVTPPAKTP